MSKKYKNLILKTFIYNFKAYFCPDGGIGRHVGLKIPFRKKCEFDSRSGHQLKFLKYSLNYTFLFDFNNKIIIKRSYIFKKYLCPY